MGGEVKVEFTFFIGLNNQMRTSASIGGRDKSVDDFQKPGLFLFKKKSFYLGGGDSETGESSFLPLEDLVLAYLQGGSEDDAGNGADFSLGRRRETKGESS